jgi:hypothetical protein
MTADRGVQGLREPEPAESDRVLAVLAGVFALLALIIGS